MPNGRADPSWDFTTDCVNGSNIAKAIEVLTAGGDTVSADFDKLVACKAAINAGGAITSATNYSPENTAAWFIFANNTIANGSTYDMTASTDVSGSIYSPPSSGSQFLIANANFTSKGNEIGSVPVPTSGLLLLLGMAGLALRRTPCSQPLRGTFGGGYVAPNLANA